MAVRLGGETETPGVFPEALLLEVFRSGFEEQNLIHARDRGSPSKRCTPFVESAMGIGAGKPCHRATNLTFDSTGKIARK